MNYHYFVFIFYHLFSLTSAIYEDQVGTFEWRQQYIGKPVFSYLDIASSVKKVVVATNKNVVAALSLKSGDILWRQILEQNKDGEIQLLHGSGSSLVTVSGARTPVVRGWDVEHGHALFEWPLGPVKEHTKWIVTNDHLIQIEFPHGEIRTHRVNLLDGRISDNLREEIDIDSAEDCGIQGTRIVCPSPSGLTIINLAEAGKVEVTTSNVLGEGNPGKVLPVHGTLPLVSVLKNHEQHVVQLTPDVKTIPLPISSKSLPSSTKTEENSYVITTNVVNSILEIRTYSLTGEEQPTLRSSAPFPDATGLPEHSASICQQRRDGSTVCRVLIVTSDYTVALLQHPGSYLWERQEALASVLSTEIVDLPVSEKDAAIEKEFGDKESGLLGMLTRRLGWQWIQNLLLTVLNIPHDGDHVSSALVRDDFGLHKLIIAITEPGKIFAIDNLSGEIIWKLLPSDFSPLGSIHAPYYAIFVMRSPIHLPHASQLAVLGRSGNGKSALLIVDPIAGSLVEPVIRLGYTVVQVSSLHVQTEDFLKVLLLLDGEGQVHVYPNSADSLAKSVIPSTFLFTIDPKTSQVDGLRLRVQNNKIVAVRSWQQKLGQDYAQIVAVAKKRDTEKVHSQGRVLGDRNVLYKYVNPNLVAIFTQTQNGVAGTVLNVYLVDAVSGLIVHSASHRQARGPIHAVHSENWLVYSYINKKHRRTEMATLELYEGMTQNNATAFSSLAAPPLIPIIESQAYILPANILALKDTITEKGITNKHIIIALSSGGVLELPWVYLDPRRTMMVTPEMREEGIVPYMPELPIPYEAIVNHNLTVVNVRGIHTAPSGLESTCLVFVYGLDLFYTRVAPSKTFDLLKEDFDYFLIAAVLFGLILASFITKRMAAKKALNQAWK